MSTEYRFLDARNPCGAFRVFEPRRRDHEYSVDHLGDYFYIRTNDQAKNFRLMKTEATATTRENWQEVIPHRQDVLLERFTLFSKFLVLEERQRGLTHVRIIPWSGEEGHEIGFDEPAYTVSAAPTPEPETTVLRYNYTSLTTPWSVYGYFKGTMVIDTASRTVDDVLGILVSPDQQDALAHYADARKHGRLVINAAGEIVRDLR